MIDITTALYNILHSRYGKDVRQSIHDGIYQIDANANEALVKAKTMGVGTAISSTTSSSTGYTEGNLYLNNSTWDIWKCIGTNSWELQGNIKGLKGDQGIAGTNGTNGKDGVDGTSYYVYVRYSEYYDGTSFTEQPTANSKYVGIYSGSSATAPTDKAAYKWAAYVGASGVNSYVHIAYSQHADGTDFVNAPTSATKYIGIYTGQLSAPPAGKQYYTWSKYVGDSGSGTGDMLKSDYASKGVSGAVDQALVANTAFGATEGLNSDYLAVGADNKLKVAKADQATSADSSTNATNASNLKKSDGTTVSADTIGNKLSAIDSKEDSSNKVTSLSSSSTDTQYPSAKCVYEELSVQSVNIVSGTYCNSKTISVNKRGKFVTVSGEVVLNTIANITEANILKNLPAPSENMLFPFWELNNNVATQRVILRTDGSLNLYYTNKSYTSNTRVLLIFSYYCA